MTGYHSCALTVSESVGHGKGQAAGVDEVVHEAAKDLRVKISHMGLRPS